MKTLVVLTTDLCNMDCGHCLFARRREEPASIPVDLFCDVLDQALPLGLEVVGFTGGEAGLHPEFAELVQQTVAPALCGSLCLAQGWAAGRHWSIKPKGNPPIIGPNGWPRDWSGERTMQDRPQLAVLRKYAGLLGQ